MGLSQSLYTGWSGMATHQKSLDNTSNNLANVNTTGYKKSDFMFSNIFNKAITGAYGADGARGTVNPKNVGLGVTTGAILANFQAGPVENTTNPLDVSIGGSGFFVVNTNSGTALTRNGAFYLDHTTSPNHRMLCLGQGMAVQGWMAENGVVTPTTTVGNIYLPANGDMLPGKATTDVDFKGILPTNTSSSDFNGRTTSDLELKGNLAAGTNTLVTHIFAPVTQTGGGTPINNEVQRIQAEISFTGPTLSPDGTVNSWDWTMKTVDWPSPGDPQVQIYPPTNDPGFSQGSVDFYTSGSVANNRGAGEAVNSQIKPGSATAESVIGGVTTSLSLPSGFTLDVSRLTALDNAPGGNALDTWYVGGNPKGTMARTVTAYDEFTDFVASVDAAGNEVMIPARRVEAREDTLYFSKDSADNTGTTWSWHSSLGDASGTLRFDTIGDLVSSTSSGGPIAYDFGQVRSINSDGSLQVVSQDGYRDGYLQNISIDQYGKIFGRYSNDEVDLLAQLAIGTVPNTSGLEKVAGTLFYPGTASGVLMIGTAGDAEGSASGLAAIGAGFVNSYTLEGSNVDLGKEFTNLISIERGYQLNSKVVTTSDEMLQTALQLKQ